MNHSDINFNQKIERLAMLLQQAECVLIGAGSGLSADAGLDYSDTRDFAEKYPAMRQYGYTMSAQLMGLDPTSEELFWGYYLAHGHNMRFGPSHQPVYSQLLDLIRSEKEYFVITTNVDSFFIRNGFSKNHVYTPQGDYGLIQCRQPCSEETWPSEPIINALLQSVDPRTGKLPRDLVPCCPNCGGPVFFNVRGGNWFIDLPYKEQLLRYKKWIQKNKSRRILLIDIGTGFNTPVWIRWPFEKLALENPMAQLVRINLKQADIPQNLSDRSIRFSSRAVEVISAVTNYSAEKK